MTTRNVVFISVVTSLAVCAAVFGALYLKYEPEIKEVNQAQAALKSAKKSFGGII